MHFRAKGERFLNNICSHTVYSAEYTGNCAEGLNEELTIEAKSRANKACKNTYLTVTGLIRVRHFFKVFWAHLCACRSL